MSFFKLSRKSRLSRLTFFWRRDRDLDQDHVETNRDPQPYFFPIILSFIFTSFCGNDFLLLCLFCLSVSLYSCLVVFLHVCLSTYLSSFLFIFWLFCFFVFLNFWLHVLISLSICLSLPLFLSVALFLKIKMSYIAVKFLFQY